MWLPGAATILTPFSRAPLYHVADRHQVQALPSIGHDHVWQEVAGADDAAPDHADANPSHVASFRLRVG